MSGDGVAERVAQAAQELYGLTPGEFTGERDQMVRAARADGDRELAAALKDLRRPTVAAWALNLLVRREPELVQQVLQVGESLRQAQQELQGEALRDLGRQRRGLVSALVDRAADLVEELGGTLADSARQQVSDTLNAALADPQAARVLMSGAVVRPLEAGVLPTLDLDEHVAPAVLRSRSSATAPRPADESDDSDSQAQLQELSAERRRLRREAAEQEVTDAEQALEEAKASAEEAQVELERTRSRVLQVEARIDEVRRSLADLESEAETAVDQAEELEQALADAGEVTEQAELDLQAARAALDQLPR